MAAAAPAGFRELQVASDLRLGTGMAFAPWVKVPFNEARYGRNVCGGIVCNNTWQLVKDAMAFWVAGQKAQGQTDAQIATYLKTFDAQDRYDIDGDGNFDEPDGFIDHFQIVHAGGDEAAGDPLYGEDAIWSHRWYASVQGGGPGGLPGINIGTGTAPSAANGNVTVPSNPTGVWVGDYTIQPENGGLGVFAHEFGHDLGLPDLYDTSGNTGGAENSTGFWTLMSSGANIGDGGRDGIGDGGRDGIGDAQTDMGTWEKLRLGWLDYDIARAGQKSSHRLAPAVSSSKQGQALITVLPDKQVPLNLGAPCPTCGSKYFYSGSGDDLSNTMTRAIPAGGALTAKVRYAVEDEFDYAFVESSTDGTAWTPLRTNLSSPASTDQSGLNASGAGIDGTSNGAWVDLTATVPDTARFLRVRYATDGGFALSGFQIDEITVGGTKVGTAEDSEQGWTFAGFRATTGSEAQSFANYYIAENRQHVGYDTSLKTAYNFGFLGSRPDFVETHPYVNGLLVNYWDTSQADNNVGDHPGQGLILPVDAHPDFYHSYDGQLLRPRILSYDSTFGLNAVPSITVHKNSRARTIPSRPAAPVFDDTKDYWSNSDGDGVTGSHDGRYQPGWYGVAVPKTGTTIRVKSVATTGFMQLEVAPKSPHRTHSGPPWTSRPRGPVGVRAQLRSRSVGSYVGPSTAGPFSPHTSGSMHIRRAVCATSQAWYTITSRPCGPVTTLLCPGPMTWPGSVPRIEPSPCPVHGPSGVSATATPTP